MDKRYWQSVLKLLKLEDGYTFLYKFEIFHNKKNVLSEKSFCNVINDILIFLFSEEDACLLSFHSKKVK